MKRGDGGRARKNKAKKDTTTTVPAIPEVPQDGRPTDQDAEPQDSREGVDSVTPSSISQLKTDNQTGEGVTEARLIQDHLSEGEEQPEVDVTGDLTFLKAAWDAAGISARQAFLPWLMSRPINELGKSLSEDIRTVWDFMVELSRDDDSA
jgi:hypothetical protein